MKIILNNIEEEFEPDSLTISELLIEKKYSFKLLIIKINEKFIKKTDYEETTIEDGDVVDIIHLISGG